MTSVIERTYHCIRSSLSQLLQKISVIRRSQLVKPLCLKVFFLKDSASGNPDKTLFVLLFQIGT